MDFDYVSSTLAASAVAIEQKPEKRGKVAAVLPQRVTFMAQYNTGKTPTDNVPVKILSLGDIQTRAGRGSMAALMYEATSRIWSGDVYWIPLADNGAGVVATKTITITGTASSAGSKSFLIAGRKITVAVASGDLQNAIATNLAAAITADLDCAFTAAPATNIVTLTARNKGLAPHRFPVIADPDLGDLSAVPGTTTFAIANATAGTTDPTIDTALANLGDAWHTVLVSPYGGTASEGAAQCTSIETAFTARIDPAVKRPFASFMGYIDTLANFTTFLGTRNSPAVTAVPVEGSPCAAFEIACLAAAIFAKSGDAHPGVPCRGLTLTGLRGNAAYAVWTRAQRDTIVKAGGSWTKLGADGTITLGDLVTTYKTNTQGVSDAGDKWRFTETIQNVQAKIYSIDALLNSDPYVRAVVLDDSAVSNKSYVVRPKTLKADLIGLVDSWIANGWSKNRDAIVAGIVVEINAVNQTRLDCLVPDVIAPGLRIIAAKYSWAFQPAA